MNPVTPLFDNGNATEPLIRLLELTGEELIFHHIDLVYSVTQGSWRKSSMQSSDIPDEYADQAEKFKPLFAQLGFIGDQFVPLRKQYQYALIGGGYLLGIRKRIKLLSDLWQQHIGRSEHVVLLGGERKLHAEKETLGLINSPTPGVLDIWDEWRRLKKLPDSEAELMTVVWMQSMLPLQLSALPRTSVCAPFREDGGAKKDPGLGDTLRVWKTDYRPEPGPCLLFYSQPGVRHAEAVARSILGSEFPLDAVGYGSPPGVLNVSQTLDAIAKVIYELSL